MDLTVTIDPGSGFCGGVIRAIGRAESWLSEAGAPLYCLGSIVHNEAELERLRGLGLETVTPEGLETLPAGATVLIRAHGEPPRTYERLKGLGLDCIDCTCPVVLRLQKSIREAWQRVKPLGGQVLLFGKVGHAEVLGLVGQAGGDVLVVENEAMLREAVRSGSVVTDAPLEVFSQTTKSPAEYAALCRLIRAVNPDLTVHDTICTQVSSRHAGLQDFVRTCDAVVFVSGRESSNGRVLFDLCRSVCPRTWRVGSPGEVEPAWLRDGDRVGVCGATSTPQWLLEAVADRIRRL